MSTTTRIALAALTAVALLLGITVIAFGDTGSAVFDQYCAGCHGASGQGTAYGPNIQGESDEVAKVVRRGDDEMPAFDSSVISDGDLQALAAYVASLGAAGDQYGDAGNGQYGDNGGDDDHSGDVRGHDGRSGDDRSDDHHGDHHRKNRKHHRHDD